MFQLVLQTGHQKDASWTVREKALIIGRGLECDIMLPDAHVSRKHCEVFLDEGQPCLIDLGSSNPTLVNGRIVDSCFLKTGDEITIGQLALVLREGEAPSTAKDIHDQSTRVKIEAQPIFLSDKSSSEFDKTIFNRPEDFVQLFRYNRNFAHAKSKRDIIQALKSAIFTSFAPQHCWCATVSPSGKDLLPAVAWHSEAIIKDSAPKDLLKKVCKEREGLLLTKRVRLQNESVFKATMVVPISFEEQLIEVIAVQSYSTYRLYNKADLRLLVALADSFASFFFAFKKEEILEIERGKGSAGDPHNVALIGESAAMRFLRSQINKWAPTEQSIFIQGDTGTGKELVAQLLHALSTRSKGALITVNCAAIPKELFEGELFGWEKGAYTGAVSKRKGLLEEAHNGTLFLDELGDLDWQHQAKILRAVETKSFRRVGGDKDRRSNFRLLSATNKNLDDAMTCGEFRSDLYHRICVCKIQTPSLKSRPDDIPQLAQHFLNAIKANSTSPAIAFEEAALNFLRHQPWPGNVRELRSCIEMVEPFASGPRITLQDLQDTIASPHTKTRPQTLIESEKKLINEAIQYCNGNVVEAAKLLGISKATLYRRLQNYK